MASVGGDASPVDRKRDVLVRNVRVRAKLNIGGTFFSYISDEAIVEKKK